MVHAIILAIGFFALSGCSSAPRTPPAPDSELSGRLDGRSGTSYNASDATSSVSPSSLDAPPTSNPVTEKQNEKSDVETDKDKILAGIELRLQALETKLNSLNDKVDSTRASMESLTDSTKPALKEVIPAPTKYNGIATTTPPASNDPEGGFVQDEAIQDFRKAMILFQGQKYPEAVLAFSDFIGTQPDHPLAASAQFYIGECYFNQKEFKLSIQEYQRALSAYENGPHTSDALRQIAFAEDQIRETTRASRHRQLLSSIFPQSPAAGALQRNLLDPPPVTDASHLPSKPTSENPLGK